MSILRNTTISHKVLKIMALIYHANHAINVGLVTGDLDLAELSVENVVGWRILLPLFAQKFAHM